MENILSALMLSLSALMGVESEPAPDINWTVAHSWGNQNKNQLYFEASSSAIVERCSRDPSHVIAFPVVLYAAHEIYQDGRLLLRWGSTNFKTANTVVSSPTLHCDKLATQGTLIWKVYGYSPYFSRVKHFPTVTVSEGRRRFFGETAYVGGIFALWIMILITTLMMISIEQRVFVALVCSAAFFNSLYLVGCTAPSFGIDLSMLAIHKWSDLFLCLGYVSLFGAFRYEKMIPAIVYNGHVLSSVFSILFLMIGADGDSVQFGTSLPFGTAIIIYSYILYKSLTDRNTDSIVNWLKIVFAVSGQAAMLFEMTLFMGMHDWPSIMPILSIVSFGAIILVVNERIKQTYRERDYLRKNLEKEVLNKTQELKFVQAELIHSAKLVSLGTLAAGLAHEINNSINYVNGALLPLHKIITDAGIEQEKKQKIDRLVAVMKDGLKLTIDIIKSLRNFSGINQAETNDVNLSEVIQSVLTILRNKIRDHIKVEFKSTEAPIIHGSVVGMNQIFMNLVGNAIDAMPDGGLLGINIEETPEYLRILVKDSGSGIPQEVRDRIFDPFFTTKEVGKGTGLGLHIVKQEVGRHKGAIEFISRVGEGTTFIITFPKELARLAA